jgi:benzoyl-CoA 2,3-dioxygenase component B
LLVNNFGDSGKLEARKLLERRAYQNTRLLGAFNEPMEHFLEFFVYTCFIDRDGKYQLTMLHHSGFAPLASSMGPMLKEEAFHLFTGQTGLARVLKAGKVPVEIIQKYLHKWLSTGQDLLGKDRSSSANRFYRWGFKGRFDEETAKEPPKDLDCMNEEARTHYYKECCDIIDILNQQISSGQTKLRAPDPRFNRHIGAFSGQPYSVDGQLLTPAEHQEHLKRVLPQAADMERLNAVTRDNDWLVTSQESSR